MKTLWNTINGIHRIEAWEPNCWMQYTCPSEADQKEMVETYQIPEYFLSDISDADERARFEY